MVFLCLEGPPGTGKEALVRHLAVNHGLPVCVHQPAPSDLADLQQDEVRWSFYTQLRILVDRVVRLRSLKRLHGLVVVGSPVSDCDCHAAASAMDELEAGLYRRWAAVLAGLVDTDLEHVRVDMDLGATFHAVVHEAKREQAHWTRERLQGLHDLYGKVFAGCRELRVDAGSAENEVMLQASADQLAKHHAEIAGRDGGGHQSGANAAGDLRSDSPVATAAPDSADPVDASGEFVDV